MGLSDKFYELLDVIEDCPEVAAELVRMVEDAPDSGERDGLMSFLYYEGIGVGQDIEKAFEYAERGAFATPKDGLSCFIMGVLCENAMTPDQATGGPRQKYDHYDAESFYEYCSKEDSRWRDEAIMWLGRHYMDFARGGDPEIGVEYFESIAGHNADAAGALSDYYWELAVPDYTDDEEWVEKLFKWTSVAYGLEPAEYAYRMGWLYENGVGCEQDEEKARKYYEEADMEDDHAIEED